MFDSSLEGVSTGTGQPFGVVRTRLAFTGPRGWSRLPSLRRTGVGFQNQTSVRELGGDHGDKQRRTGCDQRSDVECKTENSVDDHGLHGRGNGGRLRPAR